MKLRTLFAAMAVVSALVVTGSYAYADHITSQGVYTIESNIVNDVGYTGQGIKVAVIDIGFNVTDHEIAANIVEARSFPANYGIAANNDTEHGTSVAQIVVDVAPDVELHLYNYDSVSRHFPTLVDHIINRSDIDIVVMSLGMFGVGHYDGANEVSQKVREAKDSGIVWVAAAGNHARQHWSGTFADADSDGLHNFAANDESIDVTARAGSTILLDLTWDDPWMFSSNNYDLFLRDGNGNTVARSVVTQDGDDMPRERIRFNVRADDTYGVIISGGSGGAAELKLFSRNHVLNEHRVAAGSVVIPGDSTGAITVAAVRHDTETLLDYSSRGPTGDGRIKPDVAGPSHVTTSAFGIFTGTSAAAPHVAGAAALIKEANPHYTPDRVRAALEDNTRAHHPKTNQDGTGLVNALGAMEFAFVDTFESGLLQQWTEINEFDWNVEMPSENPVPNHESGNAVAHADDCDTSCTIRTAAIDLSDYVTASLHFWRYVDNDLDTGEYLRVDASPDNGTSWNTLFTWGDANDGDDDVWHAEEHELGPAYLTENFLVQFTAQSSYSGEDTEVDDVIVHGKKPVFTESFDTLDAWTESGEPDWRTTAAPPDGAGHPPGADAGNGVALANNCDSACVLTLGAPLDLTSLGSANLTMYRYVDNDLDTGEYLRVDTSTDNGTSWNTLLTWNDENGSDDDAWHSESVPLSVDHITSTEFKIRIVAQMSSATEEVMIDDIAIRGLPRDAADQNDSAPIAYSVYLADTDDREVLVFSQNGTYLDNFVSSRSNGLGKVWDVAFGPDGNLYVSDNTYRKIRQYNGTDGSPIGTSAGWAATTGYPYGLVWNDDRLYVATTYGIEAFDASGSSLGYFGDASRNPSAAGAPRLSGAQDVAFCPDGKMYVAAYSINQILYYDADDGTYQGRIHGGPFLDVRQPSGIACGAASGIGAGETSIYQSGYVRDIINEIEAVKYKKVHAVTSLVDGPYGMDLDGNRTLYVANKNDDNILRIDGTTSAVFATPARGDDPRGVTLGPVYSGSGASGADGASGFAGASEDNDEPKFAITRDGQELLEPFLLSSAAEFLVSAVDPDGDAITISIVQDAEPVLTAAGAMSIRDFGNGTAIVTVNGTGVAPGTYMPMIRVADTQDNYDDVLLPIIVP
ncbi:MAG: S8 family serine peptidase [Thaumarchaeota archaeon]|nr:S8 family serine peptidase [Nitrososphaerota archaeon]